MSLCGTMSAGYAVTFFWLDARVALAMVSGGPAVTARSRLFLQLGGLRCFFGQAVKGDWTEEGG